MSFRYLFCFLLLTLQLRAQYQTRSLNYDGQTRSYLLHVPNSYDGQTPYALIIALHGLGDNMNNFKNVGFHLLADTARFLVAVPQALVDNALTGQTAWNSGAGAFGISLNPAVDDAGMLTALMDTLQADYTIDATRMYATGFSMGGFMSNRLACERGDRLAAIASVSGTIGGTLNCAPAYKIPVAHFHGTADQTVAYTNNTYGNDPEELFAFWADANQCAAAVAVDTLPNLQNDGKQVVRFARRQGAYNTEVEFYQVIGGGHEWLTAANDIAYTREIWRFFRRFQRQVQTSIFPAAAPLSVQLFPNPASDYIQVNVPEKFSGKISILDITGRAVQEEILHGVSHQVGISTLPEGLYSVRLSNGEESVVTRLLVRH
jgi:polyhydroxybutyrate depolymerase